MMAPQYHHHSHSAPRRASSINHRARLLVLLAIVAVVGLVYKATTSVPSPSPSSLLQVCGNAAARPPPLPPLLIDLPSPSDLYVATPLVLLLLFLVLPPYEFEINRPSLLPFNFTTLQKSALSSPHDAAFHPLKLAPFSGTPWRTEQVRVCVCVCGFNAKWWQWWWYCSGVNVCARLAWSVLLSPRPFAQGDSLPHDPCPPW